MSKKGYTTDESKEIRIRIVLTSTKVNSLEEACKSLKYKATQKGLSVKGPVRLPTKKLHITTRKSPCGEGTNTWDRFQMRIHKRIIDVTCSSDTVKEITNMSLDSVQVEVILQE